MAIWRQALVLVAALAACVLGTPREARANVEGIDVSYYQGNINWTSVKSSGREFAIARVSDGTGFVDPKFATYWPAIKSAGMTRGVYQFFRPGQSGLAQANLLLSRVTLQAGDLPPVCDLEVRDGCSDARIVQEVTAWANRIQQATGRKPLLYTSPGFWNGIAGTTALAAKFDMWVAHWGVSSPSVPSHFGAWKMWQYTSSGTVPGISGRVDLDRFQGTLAQLRAYAGATPPTPDWDAERTATSFPASLMSGETGTFWVEFRNRGARTWNSSTRLGTTSPQDHASPLFTSGNWLGANRATAVDASTAPGAVGRFSFTIKAPQVTQATTFTEHFRIVQEGTTWFPNAPHDTLVTLTLQVRPRLYSAEVVASSFPPSMDEGTSATCWIEFRNTGVRAWDANTHLGTTDPQDHASELAAQGWLGNNRPAAAPGAVAPGAVGRFTFTIQAPATPQTRTIVEKLRLVQEGVQWFERSPADTLVTPSIVVRHVPKPGDLEVVSDPPGADVYLSGNELYSGRWLGKAGDATAPLTVLQLPPRGFDLRIEAPGLPAVARRVDIPDGGKVRVTEALGWRPLETWSALEPVLAAGHAIAARGGQAAPALADWNGDGFTDMVVGNGDGTIDVYMGRATGASQAPDFAAAAPARTASGPIDVSARAVPFVVDWDDDDRKDLVVGAANGKVVVFRNTRSDGDPLFAAQAPVLAGTAELIVPGGNAAPWVVDWDGDGKKDLLVGSGDGTVYLLLNVGADAAPLFGAAAILDLAPTGVHTPPAFTAGLDATPLTFDRDRDGAFELAAGSNGGDVLVARNTGVRGVPRFYENGTGPLSLRANDRDTPVVALGGRLLVGDSDRDGMRDLVIGTAGGAIERARGIHIDGDVDESKAVDARDLVRLSRAIGARRGDPLYAPALDLDRDGKIDAADQQILGRNFGRTY